MDQAFGSVSRSPGDSVAAALMGHSRHSVGGTSSQRAQGSASQTAFDSSRSREATRLLAVKDDYQDVSVEVTGNESVSTEFVQCMFLRPVCTWTQGAAVPHVPEPRDPGQVPSSAGLDLRWV